MALHLSRVVDLTVIVCLLVRKGGLDIGHAVAAVLLGFYLQGTSLAPSISQFTRS
ncbi:hypothetical protein AB0G60_20555 [Streptomyces angustmyceticus]|uniref:hypothetical protein n=1 Tax=Streptomyces angustmyceticus TaxID=285578 RepID=UPI000A38922E|nr:hypothetical protein [Streptomyces angustmyceticus]UAL66629.1 hypothetical protein K7396_08840 [Streptomyces angustmyceticus]